MIRFTVKRWSCNFLGIGIEKHLTHLCTVSGVAMMFQILNNMRNGIMVVVADAHIRATQNIRRGIGRDKADCRPIQHGQIIVAIPYRKYAFAGHVAGCGNLS